MLPRPKRLKIINHKVNKTMHSTVLSESAYSLLSSRALGNFLFPIYEVVSTSCKPCCSLRPTPNALIGWDAWWHPSQASTDQHPTPPVTHGLSVCVFRASEQQTLIIIKNCVSDNALTCPALIYIHIYKYTHKMEKYVFKQLQICQHTLPIKKFKPKPGAYFVWERVSCEM